MPHVYTLVAQPELNLSGQTEQTEEIGYRGPLLAYTLAQTLLGEPILVYEFLESECYFYGIEILSLDILDESHLGKLSVVGRADIGRHSGESGHLRCTVAALTGYDLIRVIPHLAQRQRLDDAQLPYRARKLLKSLLVKDAAGLVRIGCDAVNVYIVYGRSPLCGGIVHRYQRVQTAAKRGTFR